MVDAGAGSNAGHVGKGSSGSRAVSTSGSRSSGTEFVEISKQHEDASKRQTTANYNKNAAASLSTEEKCNSKGRPRSRVASVTELIEIIKQHEDAWKSKTSGKRQNTASTGKSWLQGSYPRFPLERSQAAPLTADTNKRSLADQNGSKAVTARVVSTFKRADALLGRGQSS